MSKPKPSQNEQRKTSNLNHYLSVVFLVVIFLGVNYVGFKKYWRQDYSVNQYLKLSEQTKNVLGSLKKEINIIVFMAPKGDPVAGIIQDDVNRLLEQYQYLSNGKVKFEQINPFRDYEKAERAAKQYKLTENENVLIFSLGDHNKLVKMADLAEIDNTMAMFGQPPTLKEFKAEQAITGAILEMVEGKKKSVVFLTGHGEADPDAPERDLGGASLLAARIKGQNAEITTHNIAMQGNIPDNTDIVVILGPKSRYSDLEKQVIQTYLRNNGRLFIALSPFYETNLENFLADYGILFSNDIVVAEFGPGLIAMEAIASLYAKHPAIQWAESVGANLQFGSTRTLSIDETKAEGVTIPLALTGQGPFWAESDMVTLMKDNKVTFDPAKDRRGELILAAAVDTGAVNQGQVNLGGTKIVAVGASHFLGNESITTLASDFFLNSMNWMLDQQHALGITPKVPQQYNASLSEEQKSQLTTLMMVVIPLGSILVGVLVWFKRRR